MTDRSSIILPAVTLFGLIGLALMLALLLPSDPEPTEDKAARRARMAPEPETAHPKTRRAPKPTALAPKTDTSDPIPTKAAPTPEPKDATPPATGDYKSDFEARLTEIATWSVEDFERIAREERWEVDRISEYKARLLEPEHWDKTCALARGFVERHPDADNTLSPPPSIGGAPLWSVVWRGVQIPVPAVPYRRLRVYRNQGTPAFFLHGDEVSILFSSAPPNTLDRAIEGLPAREGRAATKRLYGGPVHYKDLAETAHNHTPDDITCSADRAEEEVKITVALGKRPSARAEAIHAPGSHPGWILRKTLGGKITWDARVFAPGATSQTIFMSLPPDSPLTPLGSAVGQAIADTAPDRPAWLDVLVRAMNTDTPEDWQALAGAVEGSTIKTFQTSF